MKIYLSGRISGLTEKEYTENFEQAKHDVYFMYYSQIEDLIDIVNPLDLKPFLGIKMYWCYMATDLYYLSKCDAIALQKNYKDSRGARIELAFAKLLKQTIIFL